MKPSEFRPTDEVKKCGLDTIIEVMSSYEGMNIFSLAGLKKKSITSISRCWFKTLFLFLSVSSHMSGSENTRDFSFLTKIFYKITIFSTRVTSNLVIEVSNDYIFSRVKSQETVEENHAIDASTYCKNYSVRMWNVLLIRTKKHAFHMIARMYPSVNMWLLIHFLERKKLWYRILNSDSHSLYVSPPINVYESFSQKWKLRGFLISFENLL